MKRIYTTIAIIAVMMTMLCLCACSNEEDTPTPDVEAVEELPINDVAFVRSRLVAYDAQGEYMGFVMGSAVYEDEPTALYVGIEDEEEIEMQIATLIPADATVKDDGKRKVVTLTDEKGKTQGEMYIQQKKDDIVRAEVSFSKENLIDKHVSVVRFIPRVLWPTNDLHDGPMKVGQIWRHKSTGNQYVCVREPETQLYGMLFQVRNSTFVYSNDLYIHTKCFPTPTNLQKIAQILNVSRTDLWEVLANLYGMDVATLKSKPFFQNKVDQNNRLPLAYSLNTRSEMPRQCSTSLNVSISSLTTAHIAMDSRIYKVNINPNGYTLTLDCGFSSKPDPYRPHLEDFFNDLTLSDQDFELVK